MALFESKEKKKQREEAEAAARADAEFQANFTAKQERKKPLVATVESVESVRDENGISHLVVGGSILNQSDDIYGVPDLMIVSYNDAGEVISQQKFMPSATLLDSGASVQFSHTLSVPVSGVKRVSAYLVDVQEVGDTK